MAMYLHRQILLFGLLSSVFAFPEQGIFEFNLTKSKSSYIVAKSLFNGTEISLRVLLDCPSSQSTPLKLSWMLRETNCLGDLFALANDHDDNTGAILFKPDLDIQGLNLYRLVYYKSSTDEISCESTNNLQDLSGTPPEVATLQAQTSTGLVTPTPLATKATKATVKATDDKGKATDNHRKRREAKTAAPEPTPTTSSDRIYKAWKDGIYIFIVRVESLDDSITANVVLSMKGKHGYLSAIDWPFLPFYGVMCALYVIYALAWLIMSAMNWRDLLRIQFWISAVILLGLVEKAVYIEDYRSISHTGKSLKGAMYFALFLTSLKRTLARILIVIACLGYGIVKPRLGNQLQRVLALAFLFFCFSYADEVQKVRNHRGYNKGKGDFFTAIPLAVIDALFCWWIFTSLFSTMKTLRIRRNVVKLSLYNHFTNTLVLAVLISIGYMIWSLVEHRFSKCLPGWKGIWIDEAFWHFSFSFVLGIIIVLWRPTINSQRFASTPLLDDVDDEENETNLNESFGAKKRTTITSNGPPTNKETKNKKAEEDLKWIDENIPTTVVESSLPNLINDSDEEILNTKFEISKMD
ncbi:DgyrCDS5142 [Dimorphilus gyrociliatus]|uniref:DgyrCDS5142 n=1 Tax=Dimorphilus gyrociliatus TaxID=2664684 RepID=A0A7I8VJK5_9ANNE|nr:DgyrCDS5142 [Dimorphilus gyrociliatus]